MRLLRLLVLLSLGGLFAVNAAYAQQEVDPDHFDQPAQKVQTLSPHKSHQHHHQQNRTVASRHSGHSHHHHARASA